MVSEELSKLIEEATELQAAIQTSLLRKRQNAYLEHEQVHHQRALSPPERKPERRPPSGYRSDKECLEEISAMYGISLQELRKMNPQLAQYSDTDELPSGIAVHLKPKSQTPHSAHSFADDRHEAEPMAESEDLRYDTIRTIAEGYGVPPLALKEINDCLSEYGLDSPLPVGLQLQIPEPDAITPARRERQPMSESRRLSPPEGSGRKKRREKKELISPPLTKTNTFVEELHVTSATTLRRLSDDRSLPVTLIRKLNGGLSEIPTDDEIPTGARVVLPVPKYQSLRSRDSSDSQVSL